MLLSKNRFLFLLSRRIVSLICWRNAILRCLRCSHTSASCCDGGRSTNIFLSSGMGSSDWESMPYTLCIVKFLTGDVNLVFGLFLYFTWIHSLLSFSLAFGIPAHRQSLPKPLLSHSVYPPQSAVNLWRGLNATSSLLQMDLNRYPLYFLFHMHLSSDTQWGLVRWNFLQWGQIFFSCCFFAPFLSFLHPPWCDLDLQLRPRGLRISLDELLLDVAAYADSE